MRREVTGFSLTSTSLWMTEVSAPFTTSLTAPLTAPFTAMSSYYYKCNKHVGRESI